jgi:hypothetical protein
VYSLEYTNIPKVFFVPCYIGHCCTNVIRWYGCTFGHSCTNAINALLCLFILAQMWSKVIVVQQCVPAVTSLPIVVQWTPVMQVVYPYRKNLTDMDESIMCSSLVIQCEEHIIMCSCSFLRGLHMLIHVAIPAELSRLCEYACSFFKTCIDFSWSCSVILF